MSVMLLAVNATPQFGQFIGDQICAIKAAWLMAKAYPCSKYIISLSPSNEMNLYWRRLIDHFNMEVIYDNFNPGNADERFGSWDVWRRDRQIDGRPFDIYKELYRRIDGAQRQMKLCGKEAGLGRKNVFEYFYYGQDHVPEQPPADSTTFGTDVIYNPILAPDRDILIAPLAKCQGNGVFTFQYWDEVVRKLVAANVRVTVNHQGDFCNDLEGAFYRKVFPKFKDLPDEVCRHRMVACGNTGIGWVAGACGIPLLAMQPPNSNMQDYRYEWCGVKSLIDFLEKPDPDECVRRIQEQLAERTVMTTGCFDLLHAGHVRHLQESRSLGTRLIVALNGDASVRKLKGDDRPIRNQDDRAAVLKALSCVDDVRIFDGDNAMSLIEDIRPAVLTNGSDHKKEEVVGKDFVEKLGGEVVITGGERTITTTTIVKKIVKSAKPDISGAIRDAAHLSPNPPHKLRFMADEFLTVANLPGDVADLGAYRGACSLILRRLTDKTLHVVDTWTGIPHDDPLCHHKIGEWAASLDAVKEVVGNGPTTFYHQGVFPASAVSIKDRKFSFVYCDMDVYQSTMAVIEFFWPRMVLGGKMMFDDIPWEPCAGTEKAVREMFKPEQLRLNGECKACVVIKE